MTISVAIYLFPDVEVLDFAGPYEVFTTAGRVFRRQNAEAAELFRVFTVARSTALVKARAGLEVKPDYTMEQHLPVDILIIPGGVVNAELECTDIIDWIKKTDATNKITASVCTGAFLLAKAGLLTGKTATTHWEDIADLRTMFTDLTVLEGRRWVDLDSIVTSAGISAGIDMSLHLVERVAGRQLALATAKQMEVDWHEEI